MQLLTLQVRGLRNLAALQWEPAAGLNVIEGENAAGKTSLLEAIYLLARGRSFRAGRLGAVVSWETSGFSVLGDVGDGQGQHARVTVARENGQRRLRVQGREAKSMAELARWLPVQLINPDSHDLLAGRPVQRRRFVDWGVFHVEQAPLGLWHRYDRALRQRNAALRAGDRRTAAAWEPYLAEAGEALTAARDHYVAGLNEALPAVGDLTLGEGRLEVRLSRGWEEGSGLGDALAAARERDLATGHTQVGAHRAELTVLLDGRDARGQVSRGQQKVLAATLLLAQAAQYETATGQRCVVLVDDLPAELDAGNRDRLMIVLRALRAQVFLTTLDRSLVAADGWAETKLFHVEHGGLREVI